jgi:3-oxoacyl-[acyl-carrier protein] reductase
MDLGLKGKRALVGGGSSGLGAGIGTVLAAEGARVMLVGRTQARLEAAASAIVATFVVADLSEPDGPASAVRSAVVDVRAIPWPGVHGMPWWAPW